MKYFAYGLNLSHPSMKVRYPKAKPLGRYTLKGWELQFDGVATVIKSPGSCVKGGLWEITAECEASLDSLEGYPGWYDKAYADGVMFYTLATDTRGAPHLEYLTKLVLGTQEFGYADPIRTIIENCGFDIPPRREDETFFINTNNLMLLQTLLDGR